MVKVSVIIPAYNAEKYLSESIESVLNQTFKNFELIIVNDASTDNTKKIAEKIANKNNKVILINHHKNKFRSGALNTGIKKSRGEYICFLDADDKFFEDKLFFQVNYLENHSEIDMIYGGAEFLGKLGKTKILDSSIDLRKRMIDSMQKSFSELNEKVHAIFSKPGEETYGIIAGCSVMIRRKVFDKCKFDENLRNIEDYDLWYQIIGKGFKIKHVYKNFYYYRIHEGQKSKNYERMKIAKDYIFKKLKSGKYFE